MRDFLNDEPRPLSGQALVQYQAIMRHVAVEEMRLKAAELSELVDELKPNPNLFDDLSDDPEIAYHQLGAWVVRQRGIGRQLVRLWLGGSGCYP